MDRDIQRTIARLRPTVTVERHFTNLIAAATNEDEDEDEDPNTALATQKELLWRAEWVATRNTLKCTGPPNTHHHIRVAVLLIDGKRQQHPKFETFAYILCGEVFKNDPTDIGFSLTQIDTQDLPMLSTHHYDVLVVPGGSIFEVEAAVGDVGSIAIRQFVENGGGYFGVCAGGFLASRRGYVGSQEHHAIINAQTGWVPGVGEAKVTIESTEFTKRVLGEAAHHTEVTLHFANGACFGPSLSALSPVQGHSTPPAHFTPLLRYTSVTTQQHHRTFEGDDVSIAGCAAVCGQGRVVVFGPHPEASDWRGHLIVRNSILWCGRRERGFE